jgi:iron(II)-dependent oxidoreductase
VAVTSPRPATGSPPAPPGPGVDAELADWVEDARARTLALAADLAGDRRLGPRLEIVNPPGWELGHVAWFQERWCLRDRGRRPSRHADADALYDSATVPHRVRWDLPLLPWEATLEWLHDVRDRVVARARGGLSETDRYFVRLSVFHEDMHDEAFLYSRQTHGWPAPALADAAESSPAGDAPAEGDARVPGGTFLLGARGGDPFVFDNEKWAHETTVAPFSIARRAVTEGEFAAFVDAGVYGRRSLWTDEGWAWR